MPDTDTAVNPAKPVSRPPNQQVKRAYLLTFNRPKLAIPVDPNQRAVQLRKVLQAVSGVASGYIHVEVGEECRDLNEQFCLLFTTNPEYVIADAAVDEGTKHLTALMLKELIADNTGLDPKRITVVECPAAKVTTCSKYTA